MRKWIAVVVASAALAAGAALAQEKPAKKPHPAPEARVVVEGKVVCLGCWLEERTGATADCEKVGKHAGALLVGDEAWHFLDNVRGRHLRADRKLQGSVIRLSCWKYPEARALEAWGYQRKDGDAWKDVSYCEDCAEFEPGTFDRLCPDCGGK